MEKKKENKFSADAQAMEEKKYTESEFNAACSQVYQKLMREIQMRDMTNMFKRMDYLFKVIENKTCFSDSFVTDCVKEIEIALTPIDSEENAEAESKK
jgi:hypothetical protein